MPFPNQDPGIPLGPGSALPAKMPSLSQPDELERARRKKAADFQRTEAAKVNEELRRWDALPQGADKNARRLRELARERMLHQAQNIEQTGDAGVTPFDEEYLQLVRDGATTDAVLHMKDSTRTRRDMKRYAGRLLDLNTDSESADLGKANQEAIITGALQMPPEQAMPLLRNKADELELRRRAQASRAQRDNAVNYHLSRMSPAQYKAFLVRSAQQASDPYEAAHIQAQLGNHELAQAIMDSHARQQAMASAERVAGITAQGGVQEAEATARGNAQAAASKAEAENPAAQAAAFGQKAQQILASSPPEVQEASLVDLYMQRPGATLATARAEARSVMAGHYARVNPAHPSVAQHLDELVADSKYRDFVAWTQHHLNWTRQQAMNEYYKRISPLGVPAWLAWRATGGR